MYIINQVISDDNSCVCIVGVNFSIAKCTTCGFTHTTSSITAWISCRSTHKSYVDMNFARFDSTSTTTMRTNHYRAFQYAWVLCQEFTKTIAQARCFNSCYSAVLNHFYQEFMAWGQGGRRDSNIFDTFCLYAFHNHFHYIVAIAQVMMEGQSHAIFYASFFDCFIDGSKYFISANMAHVYRFTCTMNFRFNGEFTLIYFATF